MITCVQGFFEKMGWHTSSDPRRWEGDVRRNEAEVRKTNSFCGLLYNLSICSWQDISEAEKRKIKEYKEINREVK